MATPDRPQQASVTLTMEEEQRDIKRRPRPVVSCLECRRKKLKCDRSLPCEQCKKTGKEAACSYNSRPDLQENDTRAVKKARSSTGQRDDRNSTPGSYNDANGDMNDIATRLCRIEELLERNHRSLSIPLKSPYTPISLHNDDPATLTGSTLVIKGSRSRYHGQNQSRSWMNQFDDARNLMRNVSKDASTLSLLKDVQTLHKHHMQPEKMGIEDIRVERPISLQMMLEELPPREDCDRLVELYFNGFENLLRYVHKPTWMATYHKFWMSRHNIASLPFGFIPQLACIVATGLMTPTEQSYGRPLSSPAHPKKLCGLVYAWLNLLDRKQKTEFAVLQTWGILIMARHVGLTPIDEIWQMTGAAIRFAMVAGLHRDPSVSDNVTPFQAEMRRRVWVSLVEIDLQASLHAGMTTNIREDHFDCHYPVNVNDDDIWPDMAEAPKPKSLDQWTDSLVQVLLAQTLPLRLEAAVLIDDRRTNDRLLQLAQLGHKLERHISELPPPARVDYEPPEREPTSSRVWCRIFLHVKLRRTLAYLYHPCSFGHPRHLNLDARSAFLHSSLAILNLQDCVDPEFADPSVPDIQHYNVMLQSMCHQDVMQAAFVVCRAIMIMSNASPPSDVSSNASESSLAEVRPESTVYSANWTKPNLVRIVEQTIDRLIEHVDRRGSSIKDIVSLCIVLHTVRMRTSQPNLESIVREKVIKIINTCRDKLMPHLPTPMSEPLQFTETGGTPYNNVSMFEDTDPLATFDFLNHFQFGDPANQNLAFDASWFWSSTPYNFPQPGSQPGYQV